MRRCNKVRAMQWLVLLGMMAVLGAVKYADQRMAEDARQRRMERRARAEAEMRKRYDTMMMEWLQERNERLWMQKMAGESAGNTAGEVAGTAGEAAGTVVLTKIMRMDYEDS